MPRPVSSSPVAPAPVVMASGDSLIAFLAGIIGGAVTTLTAFRTRLALMDRDIAEEKKRRLEEKTILDGRLSLMARQQFLCLQILSDVAGKIGADGRFSDQIVKFLAASETEA